MVDFIVRKKKRSAVHYIFPERKIKIQNIPYNNKNNNKKLFEKKMKKVTLP